MKQYCGTCGYETTEEWMRAFGATLQLGVKLYCDKERMVWYFDNLHQRAIRRFA